MVPEPSRQLEPPLVRAMQSASDVVGKTEFPVSGLKNTAVWANAVSKPEITSRRVVSPAAAS